MTLSEMMIGETGKVNLFRVGETRVGEMGVGKTGKS